MSYASFNKTNQTIQFTYPATFTSTIAGNNTITTTTAFRGNTADNESVPSYSWTSDTNTGMYHATTSTIGFATNGVERLRITANGNVGIGTTSPKDGFTLHSQGYSLVYPQITVIEEQYAASGISPSYSIVDGGWTTRVLNTIVTNGIGIPSLSANTFTLPQGTYIIQAEAPAANMSRHRIRLYNVTANSVVANGTSENSATGTQSFLVATRSFVYVIVTISSSTAFRIDHFSSAATSGGNFGVGANASVNDVFARVIITRCQ